MTHRAAEEAPPKRGSFFQEKYMPHWAMLLMAIFWGFFQLRSGIGDAGVPPTLNQGFATMLGLWTAYVFKQINESKEKKNG